MMAFVGGICYRLLPIHDGFRTTVELEGFIIIQIEWAFKELTWVSIEPKD
jgi:hypothetical protein